MAIERDTATSPEVVGDKDHVAHVEARDANLLSQDEGLKKLPDVEKVDEFGSHTKTDPLEIALVRKLDWFMLVSWALLLDCNQR